MFSPQHIGINCNLGIENICKVLLVKPLVTKYKVL